MDSLYLQAYLAVLGGLAVFCGLRELARAWRGPAGPDAVRPWAVTVVDFGVLVWTIFCSAFLAQMLGVLWRREGDPVSEVSATVMASLLMQVGFLGAVGLFRTMHPSLFREPLSPTPSRPGRLLRHGLYGALAGLPVIYGAGLAWLWLGNLLQLPFRPQPQIELFSRLTHPAQWAGLILAAVVLAPLGEELIFRGCLYRFLKGRLSPTLAALCSAAGFAAVHANLQSFPSLLVVGYLLCRAYERSGHLGVPIVFHAFFNLNSILLILLGAGQ